MNFGSLCHGMGSVLGVLSCVDRANPSKNRVGVGEIPLLNKLIDKLKN